MKKEITHNGDRHVTLIDLTVEPGDYLEKVTEELKRMRNTTQIKGFRKGKTPVGIMKKMYGSTILARIVNDLIDTGVREVLEESDNKFLGEPIAVEDYDNITFDINEDKTYEFKLEVGIAPELPLDDILQTPYDYYEVKASEEDVDRAIKNIVHSNGTQGYVDTAIESEDMITLLVREQDENHQLLTKGLEASFTVSVSMLGQVDKDQLLGKDKGYKWNINILELEPNRDETFVRKNFLKLDEDDMDRTFSPFFEAEVIVIGRVTPAEMTEDLWRKVFGDEVSTEEEARARIAMRYEESYRVQSDGLFLSEFQDHVLSTVSPDYPDGFLKRWLLKVNENLNPDQVEQDFSNYKKDLTWSLLRSDIIKKYDLKVENDEIVQEMRQRIASQISGMNLGMDFIDQMLPTLIQDKEQVERSYENVIYGKLVAKLKEEANLKVQVVSLEELNEKISTMNSKRERESSEQSMD